MPAWGKFPLTVLNSLIALSALVDDLFSDHHADTATISMSIGVMNLIGCWFGSMPFWYVYSVWKNVNLYTNK